MFVKLLLVAAMAVSLSAPQFAVAGPATTKAAGVGEKIPSEDAVVADFHSLGLIDGRVNVFRSACPVRDLAKQMPTTQPSDSQLAQATSRLKHLHDLGIKTIISFQTPAGDDADNIESQAAIALEQSAATAAGIRFVRRSVSNSGPDSFQTMSDQQVLAWLSATAEEILRAARDGGVVFHCTAGHDRTGITAAYLRMKYQHWPVDEAIAEMRRLGHNWPRYSANAGQSSWHEEHLRALAPQLAENNVQPH